MQWNKVATRLTEHIVPGNHHTVWTGDGLNRLAALVTDALDAADGGAGRRLAPSPEIGVR
jgi:thioesterase domain-containing protein